MKTIKIIVIIFFPLTLFAQSGLVNKGAKLTIQSGAYLVTSGTNAHVTINNNGVVAGRIINEGLISLSGKWTNNATYTSSAGMVKFTGSNSSVNGSSHSFFNNIKLAMNSSSNQVQLNKDITVNGKIYMTTGDLFLNNKNVDINTSGEIIGETSSNRIYDISSNGTGTITAVRTNLTPASGESFGNIGLTITSNSNLGYTSITRSHKVQTGINATTSINRYFDITPANNSSLNATLRMNYFNAEIPLGMNETNFTIYKSTDAGSSWINQAGTVNTTSKYIQKTGINSFSRFTLTDTISLLLPVEMLTFNAYLKNNESNLIWSTASEINNEGFTIERSINLKHWTALGFVNGAGNSNAYLSYTYNDILNDTLLNEEVLFYRLKQLDFNGTVAYSDFRMVKPHTIQTSSIEITCFPNPAKNYITIASSNLVAECMVQVYSKEGLLVKNETMQGVILLDIRDLQPSVYVVVVIEKLTGKQFNYKVVVL